MIFDYWVLRVGIGFVAIAIGIGMAIMGRGNTEKDATQELSDKLERVQSKLGERKE